MRRPEARMNRCKEAWEVSLFAHGKRQSRCMQHVRAEVSVHGNEDRAGKETCAQRPHETLCHVDGGSSRSPCMWEYMNHNVLHGHIQGRGRDEGDKKGHRSISARIPSFSGNDKG